MNLSLSYKEKQSSSAILLCLIFYIILPFVLVRFFPDIANFLRRYALLSIMLPGLLIYGIVSLYAGNFLVKKEDFQNVPFGRITVFSLIMIPVNAIGTFGWMILLKVLKLQFDTDVPIENFIRNCNTEELIFSGIFICILTPLIEESIFRRVIYEGLKERCPQVFSITLASLLFGVLHGILFQLFSLFLLGIYFQILYCRDNKLGASVYAHFFNNTFAFCMLLIFKAAGVQNF